MTRQITKQRLFITTGLFCVAQSVAAEKLPNIIYILADDMGYGDIAALNAESKIPTPNLDKMVRCATTFTDAHSPSSVSTPTRYGVMTGEYCFRSRLKRGVIKGYAEPLIDPKKMTVASLLKGAGYNTAAIGKWHLGLKWGRFDESVTLGAKLDTEGNPANLSNLDFSKKVQGGADALGFDYSFILPGSLDMSPYVFVENGYVTDTNIRHIEGKSVGRGLFYTAGPKSESIVLQQVLDVTRQKALNYIENASADTPFFLYYPLTAPHRPWLPGEKYRGASGAGDYGDFVCHIDDIVGDIIDLLNKRGIAENTIVIFTSDNGSIWSEKDRQMYNHSANHIFRGQKADIWDGGHRIPFIVQWQGKIAPATLCHDIISLTDLLATCAELTGQPLTNADAIDSFSFIPSLKKGDNAPLRPNIIHHSLDGMFSIRGGEWKFIDGIGSGSGRKSAAAAGAIQPQGQLYNLKSDIGETKNLYLSEPEIVKSMSAELERIKRYGSK